MFAEHPHPFLAKTIQLPMHQSHGLSAIAELLVEKTLATRYVLTSSTSDS